MKDMLCPVKGCTDTFSRCERSLVHHLKTVHGMKRSETRLKYKIRAFGDMREEYNLRKQRASTQEERKLARDSGIS